MIITPNTHPALSLSLSLPPSLWRAFSLSLSLAHTTGQVRGSDEERAALGGRSNNSVEYEAWYVTQIGAESRLGVSRLFQEVASCGQGNTCSIVRAGKYSPPRFIMTPKWWGRCVAATKNALPSVVDKLFIEHFFSEQVRAKSSPESLIYTHIGRFYVNLGRAQYQHLGKSVVI